MTDWFALQVKPKAETDVSIRLRAKGYEEFVPRREVVQRGKSAFVPIFTGYVFCRLTDVLYGPIVTTPGVVRILGFDRRPVPIDAQELASIQLIAKSGIDVVAEKGLAVGDLVSIETGPLKGVVGVLKAVRDQRRIVVSVSLMLRSVTVEVAPDWVVKAKPAPKAISLSSYSPLPKASGF